MRRHIVAAACGILLFLLSAQASFAGQALTIVSAMPQGEVINLTQITARFSEAMRPLGITEQKAESSLLHVAAQGGTLPAGNYRWLDPATLAYIFDAPVQGPVRFEAYIPAGVTALSGASLAAEKRWRVNTPEIAISCRTQNDEPLPPQNGVIYLGSNYPLRFEDLRAKIRLETDGQSLPLEVQEEKNALRYTVQIKNPLPPDKSLTLVLDAGIRPEQGFTPSREFRFKLKGYGALTVERLEPFFSDDKKTLAVVHSPLNIRFSNPVKPADLLQHLTVSPALSPAPDRDENSEEAGKDRLERSARGHRLNFAWQPRSTYVVTLRAGLKDAYGGTLEKDVSSSFTTGDYDPFFILPPGHILEAKLGGLLPLWTRNVSPVDVRLRLRPWGDNPAAAFAGKEDAPEKNLHFVAEPNDIARHVLNLPELLGSTAGLIEAAFTFPRPDNKGNTTKTETRTRSLQVTDLGLTVKNGQGRGLAWVTDLSSGDALGGVRLSLYAENKGLLWQGVTDDKGVASLPGKETFPTGERVWLKAERGADAAVADLGQDTLYSGFSDYDSLSENERPWSAHLLSQLPLYQPGQTVRFILYVKAYSAEQDGRRSDPGDWRPLAGDAVSYAIRDVRGKTVHQGQGELNAYGSLTGQFALSDEAILGDYIVEAATPKIRQRCRARAFGVASFRSPDFKVDVTAPASRPVPVQGEGPLSATVSAGYFSGAALPQGKIALTLSGRRTGFAPPSLAGYAVGLGNRYWPGHDEPYYHRAEREIAALNAVLDAGGKASFSLPPVAVEPGRPENLRLEASVTDASGLASQGTAAFILHPSAAYVGIRAPFLAPAGKELQLGLKATSFDDKALPGAGVRLLVERRGADGGFEPPVLEKKLNLDAQGGPAAFTPPKGGIYRILAEIADDKGRKNLSETFIYVSGPGLDWGRLSGRRDLELVQDRAAYAPGDTARIVIKNPLAKEGEATSALLTVERGGVRESGVLELAGPAPVVEVPLAEKDAPYVFVSVLLIRGRTAPPPDGVQTFGPDSGAPQVCLGTIRLSVKGPDTGLRATLSTDAASYRPGAPVTAAVTAADATGRGRKAQVTLLAVDNRVLRAAGEKTRYNPAMSFRPLYSCGVSTTDNRSRLVDLGAPNPNAAAAGAARAMGTAASFSETGMRQDANETPVLREDFRPDAFWLAQAETDDAGRLSASFTLPDSLTSYRIVAVVADRGKDFATAETEITATKPLQLLSALPRFAVKGDALSARVLVQNLSDAASEVTVTASAEGLTLAGVKSRSIRLDAGKSGLVSFPLRMDAVGKGRLQVQGAMPVKGGQEKDGAVFSLPVLPAAPLTTVAAAGMLHADKTFTLPVKLPSNLDGRSRLEVVFAASPAAGLPLAARNLLEYPWQCLEQRLSRIWVRALRLGRGELLGLPADPDDRELIRKTLEAVPKFQKPDGGFAFWAELEHSDLYLTAYVLLVNRNLAALDMGLDPDVAEKAARFLSQALRGDPKNRTPDIGAFALWVLSLQKSGETSARSLFPALLAEGGKNPLGLAAMLMAARTLDVADKDKVIAGLLGELEKTAAPTPTQLHFAPQNPEWGPRSLGSTLRDNGMVLWALASVKPGYPRLEALAYWLSQGLGERKILSTQEAMFGLLGLTAYLEQLGGNRATTLKALWNGRESMVKNFDRLIDPPQTWTLPADKLPGGSESSLVLAADKGSPYWTARLSYAAPSLAAKARNAGLTLGRSWSKAGPYRMGDRVSVTLTLTVPATRRHVLLFDPFPAGLEPLHASRADLQTEDLRQNWPYPWQRIELRDSGLLLYADEVQPGAYAYTYTLRAAAPGVFVRPPSSVEEMYTPEVNGMTAAESVEIRE